MKTNQKIDDYFRALETRNAFSGVVRISCANEVLFFGNYGYASRAWKIPNSAETRFDTASITKLFTAVAVLQLIDQDLLAFDTSAITYLGLENTAISKDVNIYHLLTHTSGIADDAEEEAGEDYANLWKNKPNYSVTKAVDFLPQFIHETPNFPPGQGCRYCNCGYILLGLMIEKTTGINYRDYVRQNIFDRAGMESSDFFDIADVHENVAEGCDPVQGEDGSILGWRKNIYSFPPIGTPDSGAYVTSADLDSFIHAVKEGRLLSPEMTRTFFTPQVVYKQNKGWTKMYGHGLWFYVEPDKKVLFYEKEGENAGVSGMIRHYPDQDISVIILCNMENGAWNPVWKIHELVVQGKFAA